MVYRIQKKDKNVNGQIKLDGSKSISNRVLMIQALSGTDFQIKGLSTSKDTQTMKALITDKADGATLDTGAAGTTFRFMTALLSLAEGTQVLTGSERMKQRPIGVLVEALRSLGANIEYLEKEGYPPLKISEPTFNGQNQLSIPASVSSQYISALLMIAPTLPDGLELTLTGKIVSRPYIELTLDTMEHFGIDHQWTDNAIRIAHQKYQPNDYLVEADWSAASYYYAIAALSDKVDLQLDGLFENSKQGDAVLVEMMESFGIFTTFNNNGIQIKKEDRNLQGFFEWDFIRCPDIAQTLAVVCAALGVEGQFTGLETLRIKETDRIEAIHQELSKMNASFVPFEKNNLPYFRTVDRVHFTDIPTISTYEDHRMAMAFAPLAMIAPLQIEHPMVVVKSYPDFWKDWQKLGFSVLDADSLSPVKS